MIYNHRTDIFQLQNLFSVPPETLITVVVGSAEEKMIFYIFAALSICGLIYYWLTMKFDHFKNHGVPGPHPKFPFGNTPNAFTQKRNMTYDLDDIYR